MFLITGWTALVCGTFFMFLTRQVINARGTSKVSVGDGGDEVLLRRIRGQANAAEQMPITLIVLGLAEGLGGSAWVLVPLAAIFTAGRISHGVAFGWLEKSLPLRFYGMLGSVLGTLGLLAYLGILLLMASFG